MSVGGLLIFVLGLVVSGVAWRGFGLWCLTRIPYGTVRRWWMSAWAVFFLVPIVLMALLGEGADLVISVVWVLAVSGVATVVSGWELRLAFKLRRIRKDFGKRFGDEELGGLDTLSALIMQNAEDGPQSLHELERIKPRPRLGRRTIIYEGSADGTELKRCCIMFGTLILYMRGQNGPFPACQRGLK